MLTNDQIESDDDSILDDVYHGDWVKLITTSKDCFEGEAVEVTAETIVIEIDADNGESSHLAFSKSDIDDIFILDDDDEFFEFVEAVDDILKDTIELLRKIRRESREKRTKNNLCAVIGSLKSFRSKNITGV